MRVELTVVDAKDLKALYFDLNYDDSRYIPVRAEATGVLAGSDSDKLLQLAVLDDAGTVHAGQVLARPAQQQGFTGSGVLATVTFRPGPASVSAHTVTKAPVSDASATVLTYDAVANSLSWGYCCSGDYDQNGLVTISDLTGLAVHYGATGGPFDKVSIESVVDGDGNGEINIQDITPIGVNFDRHIESYNLYTSAGTGSYPASNAEASVISPTANIPYAQFTGSVTSGRLQYSYQLGAHPALNYWVRPADAGTEGTASNMVSVPATNNAPTIDSVMPGAVSIASGATTSIDVLASDADGDTLSYSYSASNGTVTGSGNSVTYTAPVVVADEQVTVTVGVNDGKGGSDSAQIQINIVAPAQHWNFMVWVAGDNNLAQEAVADINEMEAVGSTEDVRVFVGFDIDPNIASGVSGTNEVHFIKVVQDGNPNVIRTDGDPANMSFPRAGYNSADPAHVRQFVDWVNANFPAQHTALVLWNHGDGWIPGTKTFSNLTAETRADKRERMLRGHNQLLRLMHPSRGTSGVLADDTNGDLWNLSNNESIVSALSGLHFDVLEFDACNMGQLEALYDYRNVADVLVGSECLVPGTGLPYSDILNAFNAAPTRSANGLGSTMVDKFVSYYTATGEYAILSSMDSSKLDTLTSALAAFAGEVTTKAGAESQHVKDAISGAFEPDAGDGSRDLSGFLTAYNGLTTDASIKARIGAAQAALNAALLDFDQFDQAGSNGTTVWLPSDGWFDATHISEYDSLAFDNATGWLAMLQATGVPGGGGGGSYDVNAPWSYGDYIVFDWGDNNADADMAVTDPSFGFWSPSFGDQDTPDMSLSLDSADSGQPQEWAQLKIGAEPGEYYFDLHWYSYNGPPPPTLDVSVKLYDMNMQFKQDLGVCSIANVDDYVGYCVLYF